MKRIIILLLAMAACGGEHRDARDTYNEGVTALASGDLETAEKKLLDARSAAGIDPDLRFSAAYDLGVAYALHADKLRNAKDTDLPKALELAQQSVSWFSDAARLRKDDANTQANLAIVRARVQSISDELNKGAGKLEARLDALIGDQRGVLEDARGAWLAIKTAGGTDPLAQQGTLTHLADRERGIVAEAGVITDLASDEIDAIGKKPEDKRNDEEKVRVLQLKNVDLYLIDGRTRIADARRKLQELAAEDGVTKAEAALVALKRAREQLLDPITVLKGVAQDELEVLQDTARASAAVGTLELGPETKAPQGPQVAWLQPSVIGDRQGGLRDRLEEVRARLAAAVESPPDPNKPQDPKQAKLLERVRAALPSVAEASVGMDHARESLGAKKLPDAIEQERTALIALSRAIEQFSDLKQTIELAYGEQQRIVGLLSPEGEKLPVAERSKETRDGLARNLARMTRLKELIADEVAQLAAKEQQLAQQAAAPPAGAGSGAPKAPDPKQLEAAKQQLAQAKEQLTHAEELRAQAQAKLEELDKALTAAKDPQTPAKEAETKLEDLRKLFFSVIEHLQQLIRDQGETRDQSSAANADDQFTREPKLPALIGREDGHGKMAKAITDALAAQADAASKKQQGPSQPGAPDPKTLAAAADEVRQAQSEMSDASRNLVKARDAKQSSESLNPGIKSQGKAIEHLEEALKLLQPPPKDQKQDQQKQDQKKQDQKKQDQQKQDQQQQKGGASQRARDEDARRQKERRKQEAGTDPVEKDW